LKNKNNTLVIGSKKEKLKMEFMTNNLERTTALREIMTEAWQLVPAWLIVSVVLLAGAAIALLVCLVRWFYADAKERTDSPILWTLFVFCFPLVGLAVYLLVGRDKNKQSSNRHFKPVLIAAGSVAAILPVAIISATYYVSLVIEAGLVEAAWNVIW